MTSWKQEAGNERLEAEKPVRRPLQALWDKALLWEEGKQGWIWEAPEERIHSTCHWLDVDREGGGTADLGKVSVGSVLRGKFGSRHELQWKVFARGGKDVHIGRSVLSIDYLIKPGEFLYEIGYRYHTDLKWQYQGATSGSHRMGEQKKAIWSRITNPGLNPRCFFPPPQIHFMHLDKIL